MRTELDVPFSHKDEAKALGAKWDRAKKIWYVPDGVNPEPFAAWLSGVDRSDPNAPYIYLVLGKRECWKCHGQTTVAAFGIPYRAADDSDSLASPSDAPAVDDAGHVAIDTSRANAVAIVPALGCVPAEIRNYLRQRCGYKPVGAQKRKGRTQKRGNLPTGDQMEQQGAQTGEEQGGGHVQTGDGGDEDGCAEHGEQMLDAQNDLLGASKGAGVVHGFVACFGICHK